ncbi:MAG TPA: glycosyltransferase family 2 protein [Candidatus Saccharimonadales bacterium]|nr:glycosyltransferase family 2 protein [Candidatus Saccharimonadales bacterium]
MSTNIERLEVNFMAQFFYSRSDATGIVTITNRPELLVGQFPTDISLFIVCNPWRISRLQAQFGPLIPNATFIMPWACTKQFLKNKLLVCHDYLTVAKPPSALRKLLIRHLSSNTLISILSLQSSATDKPVKVFSWMSANKTLLVGRARRFSGSPNKDQVIAIGGRLTDISRHKHPLLPVLAVMHVYNEQDIIAATIGHLLQQGTDVHIIDNWSTDKSYSIVQSMAANSSRITYERFPEKPGSKFELGKILKRVTDVAKEKERYKWILLNDADEIRWSPWSNVTLQEALSFIDSLGYSAVDYTVFNFIPTKEGFSEKSNPLTFFKYGEFSGMEGHFVQVKTWKNNSEAELAPSGGHHVAFTNQKIFPLKFFLGHYPIRSTRHGREKIFKHRRSRFTKAEKQKGWHVQYNEVDKSSSFIRDKKYLLEFGTKSFWSNYILERLSGVGIKRD